MESILSELVPAPLIRYFMRSKAYKSYTEPDEVMPLKIKVFLNGTN